LVLKIRNLQHHNPEPLSYFISMSRFHDAPYWLNWLRYKHLFKDLSFSISDFQNSVRLRLFIQQQVSDDVSCMCTKNKHYSVVPVSKENVKNLNHFDMMFHPLSCKTVAAELKKKHDKIAVVIHNFLILHCKSGKIISQMEELYKCMANGERHHVDIMVSIDNVTYYVDVSIFNCGSSSNARLNDKTSLTRMQNAEN